MREDTLTKLRVLVVEQLRGGAGVKTPLPLRKGKKSSDHQRKNGRKKYSVASLREASKKVLLLMAGHYEGGGSKGPCH